MRLLKKWLSPLSLLLLVLPLNACVEEPEWKTIYLKMGTNVLEWQAMQTEWQPDLEAWIYASSPRIFSNFKVYLEKDLWLDIPYADATLFIANGRIFIILITSWAKEGKRELNEQPVQNLVKHINRTLQNSATWVLRPDQKLMNEDSRWIVRDDPDPPTGVHRNISVGITKGNMLGTQGDPPQYWLRFTDFSTLNDCFGGLNSHMGAYSGAFRNSQTPAPREVSQYLHHLGGNNITALEIMGTDDPKKLPLKEYLRRVDLYMEKVCPELLDRYGRFQG